LSSLSRARSGRSISTRYSASLPSVGRGSRATIRTRATSAGYTGDLDRERVTSLQHRVGRDHTRISGIAQIRPMELTTAQPFIVPMNSCPGSMRSFRGKLRASRRTRPSRGSVARPIGLPTSPHRRHVRPWTSGGPGWRQAGRIRLCHPPGPAHCLPSILEFLPLVLMRPPHIPSRPRTCRPSTRIPGEVDVYPP
jgi:hypothetical protein